MRILLVEDNIDIAEAVCARFGRLGHAIEHCVDGIEGEVFALSGGYDVMILDLNLPGKSGFEVMKALRLAGSQTPVLVLTASNHIADKINLLDLGADDYLVKPFDMGELEARLRAISRRFLGSAQPLIEHGALSVDLTNRSAAIGGLPVDIGRREFEVLESLVTRYGTTVNKELLVMKLFAHDDVGTPNAVELLVSRLRRKLQGSGLEIVTQRGVGYLLRKESEAADSGA
ncbi:MAG: response regulator transcription factor [Pseudorhodobacter sp.]